jgi:hypothetical protein
LSRLLLTLILVAGSFQASAFFCLPFGNDHHRTPHPPGFAGPGPVSSMPPPPLRQTASWREPQAASFESIDVISENSEPEIIQGYRFRPTGKKQDSPQRRESLQK